MTNSLLDVIVIGSGGLAREFTSYFSNKVNILGYSTVKPDDIRIFDLNGMIFSDDLIVSELPTKNLVIAIGNPKIKKELYQRLSPKGFNFPSLVHDTAIVSSSAALSDGVIVCPLSIVGPNVRLGILVYCNYHVGIGHDSCIGNFTQVNVGSQIGGGVSIHSESLIGSNSTLLQSSALNAPITVGSGSVVIGRKSRVGTIAPIYSKYLPF